MPEIEQREELLGLTAEIVEAHILNKEAARRKARKHKMYGSLREALNPKKPK